MCGRYALTSSVELLVELFGLSGAPTIGPRYNIAPTQLAPVVRLAKPGEEGRRLDMLHWGLIPFWAKDPVETGGRMINARSETAAEKPAFREALRRRRCLVPADGFFEWRKMRGGKQPYWIRRRDGAPLAFAGLWERWRERAAPGEAGADEAERTGGVIDSFAILTTTPNALVEPLHDRMPVIIEAKDFERWLDRDVEDAGALKGLFVPLEARIMEAHPVSRHVNSAVNDDPGCLERVEVEVEAEKEPKSGEADDEMLLF